MIQIELDTQNLCPTVFDCIFQQLNLPNSVSLFPSFIYTCIKENSVQLLFVNFNYFLRQMRQYLCPC